MDDRLREWLRLAGVQLALIAAGLHLFWGVPRAFVYLRIARLADPRPFVFTLSALAVVAAVVWLYRGGPERRLYAFLAVIMATYLGGYAAWHLVGHPVVDPAGGGLLVTYHPDDPVGVLAGHLAADRFALAAAVAESGAIVSFVALLALPEKGGTP